MILQGWIQLLLFSILGGFLTMLQIRLNLHTVPANIRNIRFWINFAIAILAGYLIGMQEVGYIP